MSDCQERGEDSKTAPPKHQITTPAAGDPDVSTYLHGAKYSIDVTGSQPAGQNAQISDVWAQIFRTQQEALDFKTPNLLKSTQGDKIVDPSELVDAYEFMDQANIKSVPIAKLNSPENYLQVLVKFVGTSDWVQAEAPIQFTPKST